MSTYHQSTVTTSTPETVRVQIKTHVYGLLQELANSNLAWNSVVKTILRWTPEDCRVEVQKLIEMNRNIVMQFGRTFYKQLRTKFYEENNTSDALPFTCGQFVTQDILGDFLSLYVRYLFQSAEIQVKSKYAQLSPQDKDIVSRDAYVQAFNKLLLDTYDTLMSSGSQVSYQDIHRSIKSFQSKKSRRSRTSSQRTAQPTPQHASLVPDDSVAVAASEISTQAPTPSHVATEETLPQNEQEEEDDDENNVVVGNEDDVDASLRKIGDSLVGSSRPIAADEMVEVEVPTVVDNVAPLNRSSEHSEISRRPATSQSSRATATTHAASQTSEVSQRRSKRSRKKSSRRRPDSSRVSRFRKSIRGSADDVQSATM